MTRFIILTSIILSSLTPAWAGPGWHLMVPFDEKQDPLHLRDSSRDLNKPLNQWQQMEPFDTAEACEGRKIKRINSLEKKIKEAEKRNRDNLNFDLLPNKALLESYKSALCIASDDPRLK